MNREAVHASRRIQQEPPPGTWRWTLWRLRRIVAQEGWASLWFRGLALVCYRRTGFMVCRLDASARPVQPKTPPELVTLTPADAAEYVAFRRGAREVDFQDRLARGFVCHAARCDGRLASVTWVAWRQPVLWLLDAEFDLDPGDVYLFDSFTHPDFRGLRLQGAVFARICDEARRVGRRRAVTCVVPENHPSLQSRRRMGFQHAGLVCRLHVGPLRWYFARGDAPKARRRRQ